MDIFFDMHCHLGFAPAPAASAEEGAARGIHALSCTVEPCEYRTLAEQLASASNVRVGLGAHPWWIADGHLSDAQVDDFCEMAPETTFVGEIGLDFAKERGESETRQHQESVFRQLLEACNVGADGKLISLHAAGTGAVTAALDILEDTGAATRHTCIFHWFSGSSEELERAIKGSFFFSAGYRMCASKRGREYLRRIPLNRLLLETDAPKHADDVLPADEWHALLNNAFTGIAQLKGVGRETLAEQLAQTSRQLLQM